MASLTFFPSAWVVDPSWSRVYVHGRTAGEAVLVDVLFRPFFTIRHPNAVAEAQYLLNHSTIVDTQDIADDMSGDRVVRAFAANRDDYETALALHDEYGRGTVVDRRQSPLSKFMAWHDVTPGRWQSIVHPTVSTVSDKTKSRVVHAAAITSLEDIDPPPMVVAFDDGGHRTTLVGDTETNTSQSPDWVVTYDANEKTGRASVPGTHIIMRRFFERVYPQFNRHDRETMATVIGTSTNLADMWRAIDAATHVHAMSDFWRSDPRHVLDTSMDDLFSDLVHVISPGVDAPAYNAGRPLDVPGAMGVAKNVELHSLSSVYLEEIDSLGYPLALDVAEYFAPTSYGVIPFRSGYFDVSFNSVLENLPPSTLWATPWHVATTCKTPLEVVDEYALVVAGPYDRLTVDALGIVMRFGTGALARPRFPLEQKSVRAMVDHLLSIGRYPTLPSGRDLSDYVMTLRVHPNEWTDAPPHKRAVVSQLTRLGMSGGTRDVSFVRTVDGPVVEPITRESPAEAFANLDRAFYLSRINETLEPFGRRMRPSE